MSFVVTAKITFLSGLSCAGTIPAAMRARAATPSVRMTKRFMGPPAWRAARKLGGGLRPPSEPPPRDRLRRRSRRSKRNVQRSWCFAWPCGVYSDRRLGPDDLVGLRPEDHASLDDLHEHVQRHAEHGEQDHDGEDARDIEVVVELENQGAETALRAHELSDDRPQHAEDDGDVEPGEDEGQRVGELHQAEGLPARRIERAHEVELALVH